MSADYTAGEKRCGISCNVGGVHVPTLERLSLELPVASIVDTTIFIPDLTGVQAEAATKPFRATFLTAASHSVVSHVTTYITDAIAGVASLYGLS